MIGVLHPGAMGISVAAAALSAGHNVGWCRAGRSAATAARASGAGLREFATLDELVAATDLIIAVCPPGAARATASAVIAAGFRGNYLDANAIAPATAAAIAALVDAGGARWIDGGIIGPPATRAGSTRLYLSGSDAAAAAACFSGSTLEAIVLDDGNTTASALKMCYAAWTKGSSALLLAVAALARQCGVETALAAEWQRSLPDLESKLRREARNNAPKAWRFVAEMEEIAACFAANELPPGFHHSAAEIFTRLAAAADGQAQPTLAALLDALAAAPPET